MTKIKHIKQIREIAAHLPPIAEQKVSGFEKDGDQLVPYTYNVPVNHERRLRKAYELLGMEGISKYLDWVSGLQKKRREDLGDYECTGHD